jgi:hypothetical protein
MDAGGLIALDRDDRRVVVLLARARETGARVTGSASVLAQAIRRPDKQVRLSRFIRQPTTDVIDLGRVDATSELITTDACREFLAFRKQVPPPGSGPGQHAAFGAGTTVRSE